MQLMEAIEAVRPSVVQIRRRSAGSEDAVVGSGFVVSDDHVVTAKHVVDAIDSAAGHSISIAMAVPDVDLPHERARASFIQAAGHVLATDHDSDLALIEVPHITRHGSLTTGRDEVVFNARVSRLNHLTPREGNVVALSGYPLPQPSLVTTAGVLASTLPLQGSLKAGEERLLGDFTVTPGSSGGPVYTIEDAMVVGVCIAGRLAPVIGGHGSALTGLALVVPARTVIGFMEAMGARYSLPALA